MSTGGWPPQLRTVVRSALFEERCKSLNPSVYRLDEQLEGIEGAVSRDPSYFAEVPGTTLRIVKTVSEPHLRVYFTADDDEIRLEWIEEVEDAPEEDHS